MILHLQALYIRSDILRILMFDLNQIFNLFGLIRYIELIHCCDLVQFKTSFKL